jgi:DNA-binding NtrC family response regulator
MRFSAYQPATINRTLAAVESEYIRSVLLSTNNNKTEAAKILEIDRKTLREKLEKAKPSS